MNTQESRQKRVCDIRLGEDSHFDAWLYSMLMDNNLAYNLNPHLIASQEQLRFMVQLSGNQIYLPCSDETFFMLGHDGSRKRSVSDASYDADQDLRLQKKYNRAWRIITRIICSSVTDPAARTRLFRFCGYRFKQSIAHRTLIPQRLVKRMTDLVLKESWNAYDDPWAGRRREAVLRHKALLQTPAVADALDAFTPKASCTGMRQIRCAMNSLLIIRLFCLSLMARFWEDQPPSSAEVSAAFRQAEQSAEPLWKPLADACQTPSTILYLADADGSPFFDLHAIRALIRMGHRVVYAVKDGFYFYAPTMTDLEEDPVLEELCRDAAILKDKALSKNDLLKAMRAHKLVVINDGTRERLNLYRVSLTFARAWKEADLICARGWRARDILLETSHEFTRPVVCFWVDEERMFHVERREKAPLAHKLSEQDIMGYADQIIRTMREAHRQEKSVMFFSCIIGSIPGQTRLAITLARTFVEDLRRKLDNVFIINPAEHFIEGMDGDDLMFMWERVQRSGQIDIWRFQTTDDIERSFALLHEKVPHIWSGKDATYSTGCTKEMQIALDVQEKNREMQIIGPDPKLFFRRGEYGVGKYFDANIGK